MKRKELIKIITTRGCVFIRHGGKHDAFEKGKLKGIPAKEVFRKIDKINN